MKIFFLQEDIIKVLLMVLEHIILFQMESIF